MEKVQQYAAERNSFSILVPIDLLFELVNETCLNQSKQKSSSTSRKAIRIGI